MIVLFIVIIEVFFYVNLLVWIMNIGNNWIFWDYVILYVYVNFLYLKILKFNYNNLVWWFWIVINIFILNIGFRFEK